MLPDRIRPWLLRHMDASIQEHMNPLEKALHLNYVEYMKNDDIEGFLSDMSLLLQCHIEDEEDAIETLRDNVADMQATA
jgi:hypothetical protein